MKDDLTKFGSEDEYISAIKRTASEMSSPPGMNTRALAEKVTRAYWAAREEAHRQGQGAAWPDYAKTTAELARATAAKMENSRVNPWKPFLSEALFAFLPGLIFFSLIYLVFRPGDDSAGPVIRLAPAQAVGIAALFCLLMYLIDRYFRRKTDSMGFPDTAGALVGGFVGAALIAVLGFYQVRQTETLSTALAHSKEFAETLSFGLSRKEFAETLSFGLSRKEFAELALTTMERMSRGEEIPKISYISANVPVETQISSNTEVKYTASIDAPKGMLIAELSPEKGTLYWKYANDGKLIEAECLVGTVVKEERQGIILHSSDGPNTWIGFRENITDKPQIGDRIIVVIDTETYNAITIRTLKP